MSQRKGRVIIIGSGIAGITTALNLIKRGYNVDIFEKYPVPGGRTSNFQRGGMALESGLHNYFGFYHNLSKLIKDSGLNIKEIIHWDNAVYIASPNHKAAKFTFAPLVAPIKTIASLVGNTHFLSVGEKLHIIKLYLLGLKDYVFQRQKLDEVTIGEYTTKHNIPNSLIEKLVSPLSEGIFFLKPSEQSALVFFSTSFPHLPHIYKAQIGLFKGGMTDLLINPLIKRFKEQEGNIYLSKGIDNLLVEEGRVVGVSSQERDYHADAVVIATGIAAAKKLILTQFMEHDFARDLDKLQTIPTVGMQINLTETLINHPSTHLVVGTNVGTFAEQSHYTFPDQAGRISLVFKNTEELLDKSDDQLIEIAIADFKKLGFDIKEKIENYSSVRWEHDFYSMKPGSERLRPRQTTSVPGLFLAGDYTKQKFLSTMEGACYSGTLAARAVSTSLMPVAA